MQREYTQGFTRMLSDKGNEIMRNPPLLNNYAVDIEKLCSSFGIKVKRVHSKVKSQFDTITNTLDSTITIRDDLTKSRETVAIAYGLAYIIVDDYFDKVWIPLSVKVHSIEQMKQGTIEVIQKATYDNFVDDVLLPDNILITLFGVSVEQNNLNFETISIPEIDFILEDIADEMNLPLGFIQNRFSEVAKKM